MKIKLDKKYMCVLCKEKFEGVGNNPEPLTKGVCCDDCNYLIIIVNDYWKKRIKRCAEYIKNNKTRK